MVGGRRARGRRDLGTLCPGAAQRYRRRSLSCQRTPIIVTGPNKLREAGRTIAVTCGCVSLIAAGYDRGRSRHPVRDGRASIGPYWVDRLHGLGAKVASRNYGATTVALPGYRFFTAACVSRRSPLLDGKGSSSRHRPDCFGPFRVRADLGASRFGPVYLGRDPSTDTRVVIRTIRAVSKVARVRRAVRAARLVPKAL